MPNCGDVIDKIFALLSLICELDRAIGIEADYAIAVSNVYEDVMKKTARGSNPAAVSAKFLAVSIATMA